MIQFNAAPAFDFDEWAALYRHDPAAFEARRKALLTIEVARSGRHSNQARELLERLEQQLEGKSDADRIRLSMLAMQSSAARLVEELQALSAALQAAKKNQRSLPPDQSS